MQMIDDVLNGIVDSVAEAIMSDLSHPETIEQLREMIDELVIRATGLNINNPFIRPHYEKFVQQYQDSFLEILGVATSNPPDSIDETSSFMKEEFGSKVDSLAERLKKRMEK